MVQANSFMNPFIYAFKVHSYILTYNLHAFKHLEYIYICIFADCDELGKGSKTKWKFLMVFAMKGRGLACHDHFFKNVFFTRPLLQKGSSLQEEILSVCLSVCLWICLSVITFSFFEYSMI